MRAFSRDFARARERRLGPAIDVVFDRLVRQRSGCRHLRARLVERLAFEPLLVGPVEQAAGFLETSDARRGSKIDWTSAAKDALLWVQTGGHGHPVKHLGLASRCAGF